MKILVTGASGFIGKYLTTHLSNNHEVSSPSSRELDLTDTISVNEFFKDHQFDIVIHAAVRGRNNVQDFNSPVSNDIVNMFVNLVNNRSQYTTLINFGSGAEFGLDQNVYYCNEDDIVDIIPKESYGLGKNLIARTMRSMSNFYNLRIFSCFDPSEDGSRLITKFKQSIERGDIFELDQDRYVDFVSLQDIAVVVDAVLNNQLLYNDVNVVYQDKMLVSDILLAYCKIHGIDTSHLVITGTSNKHYTGNGDRLAKHNLKLQGIIPTLQRYKHGSI
jgi:nucleoside-diphosphate-sugar epimerase